MDPLTVGDRSHDGQLEITETRWDGNGTLTVTVRELVGARAWPDGLPVERMRRLARRALMHPEKTRSARVVKRLTSSGFDHVVVAVSRLDPHA